MLYIQIPENSTIEKSDDGFRYFTFSDEQASIKIVDQIKIYQENGNDLLCSVSIFRSCPDENADFYEYLPVKDKPSIWGKVVNGHEKNNFIHRTMSQCSWVESTFLTAVVGINLPASCMPRKILADSQAEKCQRKIIVARRHRRKMRGNP